MNIAGWVRGKIASARRKDGRELAKAIALRVWPLSTATRGYYRARFWWPVWFGVLNRRGRTHLRVNPPTLDAVQRRIVEELQETGLSVVKLEELFDDPSLLQRCAREAERLLQTPDVEREIRQGKSELGGKDFVVRALGPRVAVDPGSELFRLAIDDRMLDIVNGYLQMFSRLKYIDLWFNLPVDDALPLRSSQRWHRDYDDKKLVKTFLYLCDVDESMGAFSYVKRSHHGGRHRRLFPQRPPEGAYPPDGGVEAAVRPDETMVCSGPAGTLIFCDTSGLHRGGRSTTQPRILFTVTYASDGGVERDRYRLGPSARYGQLSPAAKFAIRYPGGPRI